MKHKKQSGYWYYDTTVNRAEFIEDSFVVAEEKRLDNQIGNCFETKEEAELAVRKLKGWKRLKDKGIKIIDYECCGGVSKKGEFLGEVKVTIDVPQEVDKYLFETLFGGEDGN